MSDPQEWKMAMHLKRSLLDGDVWVPQDPLDITALTHLHAGSLQTVKDWSEEEVRALGKQFDAPVKDLRWTQQPDDSWLLEVLD